MDKDPKGHDVPHSPRDVLQATKSEEDEYKSLLQNLKHPNEMCENNCNGAYTLSR